MTEHLILVVTRMRHTHLGVTYLPGQTFEGTQRLLETFSDRLAHAPVKEPAAPVAETGTEGVVPPAPVSEQAATPAKSAPTGPTPPFVVPAHTPTTAPTPAAAAVTSAKKG